MRVENGVELYYCYGRSSGTYIRSFEDGSSSQNVIKNFPVLIAEELTDRHGFLKPKLIMLSREDYLTLESYLDAPIIKKKSEVMSRIEAAQRELEAAKKELEALK